MNSLAKWRDRIVTILLLWLLIFSISGGDWAGRTVLRVTRVSANPVNSQETVRPSDIKDSPRRVDDLYGIKFGGVVIPETIAIPAGKFNMGQPNRHIGCHDCTRDEQ